LGDGLQAIGLKPSSEADRLFALHIYNNAVGTWI